MENEANNLNTEDNDIAGNRIDGPIGNTAARPTAPNAGVGIPGGPPLTGGATAAGSVSNGALAAAETSPDQGTATGSSAPQENNKLDPADLAPAERYGGNFSNSTQGSYNDQSRRDNQDSDPNRGEFGAQDLEGTTHGGYGNQNRVSSYEPHNSAEDQYYGGAGKPGVQDNAYRAYDGRDELIDPQTEYGFVAGATTASTSGQAADEAPRGPGLPSGPHADNTNQPERTDAMSAHQNDNGSPVGPDRGFAADYGHTSLPGTGAEATPDPATTGAPRRNQNEDGQSSRGGYENQGRAGGPAGHGGEAQATSQGARAGDDQAERPLESQGYGDRGRDEPRREPDYRTGDDRNGYGRSFGGSVAQGTGSRGGSYNDQYDDSQPGSRAGSPAQGEQRIEDRDRNYGEAAREENRSDTGDDNAADHGAPRRNAGREGEGDE